MITGSRMQSIMHLASCNLYSTLKSKQSFLASWWSQWGSLW
jgi:hypothetical protein